MPIPTRSICVFCGARPGRNPAHAAAARAFGAAIAANGWRLVFGAGDIGLMGEVARAAQSAGAATLGVIPVHLIGAENRQGDLTRFVITQDMRMRRLHPIDFPLAGCGDVMRRRAVGSSSGTTRRGPYAPSGCCA